MKYSPDTAEFEVIYTARLIGLLRWPQWQTLLEQLRQGHWYFYDLAQPPPAAAINGSELHTALASLDGELRAMHQEDYFGLAYTDKLEGATLVKIYHPRRLGSVCGSSGAVTLPAWVISRMQPMNLAPAPVASMGSRQWLRWLRS